TSDGLTSNEVEEGAPQSDSNNLDGVRTLIALRERLKNVVIPLNGNWEEFETEITGVDVEDEVPEFNVTSAPSVHEIAKKLAAVRSSAGNLGVAIEADSLSQFSPKDEEQTEVCSSSNISAIFQEKTEKEIVATETGLLKADHNGHIEVQRE